MKIFLNILNLFVVFLLIFILVSNVDRVTVHFFNWTSEPMPVFYVILLSTAFGALFGVLFSSASLLKQRSEMRQIRKQNKQLKQELDNLRNMSIEEIPTEPDMTEDSDKPMELTDGSDA